jgi:mycothiol synthase
MMSEVGGAFPTSSLSASASCRREHSGTRCARKEHMPEETGERSFVFRHYVPATDLAHLSALLTTVEAHDQDGEDTSETALREQLTWPQHAPEHDCWVSEAPGSSQELIGYGSVFAQTPLRSTLWVAVHPAWRRQGLGSVLLTKALERARETGAKQVTVYANAHNPAATAFLPRHGFWRVGSSWVLRAPPDLVLEAAQWPAGYMVRSYAEVQQLSTLLEVLNRSYADKWGHAENSQTTTEAKVLPRLASADPGGIFLAIAPSGSVAGFCRAIPARPPQEPADSNLTDEVEQPGVVPEHRHQQLYRPLVLTALHWLRAQGHHAVLLQSWGDDEQTIASYQDAGLIVLQRWLAYRYDL